MDAVEFRFPGSGDPLRERAVELRFRVLRDPLGLPPEAVRFPFEDESLHLVALDAGQVTGCVLFHPDAGGGGRLYQMAVEPHARGRGLGRALVTTLEAKLRRRGIHRVDLHAREGAVGFYERLGYCVVGEPFIEVGIPHRTMTRELR